VRTFDSGSMELVISKISEGVFVGLLKFVTLPRHIFKKKEYLKMLLLCREASLLPATISRVGLVPKLQLSTEVILLGPCGVVSLAPIVSCNEVMHAVLSNRRYRIFVRWWCVTRVGNISDVDQIVSFPRLHY
jgi:hypothetical protein